VFLYHSIVCVEWTKDEDIVHCTAYERITVPIR
jgi:hypothetical protein